MRTENCILESVMTTEINDNVKTKALEKVAFPNSGISLYPNPFGSYTPPPPTVSDVLNAIGQAQVQGIGTPNQRKDAFGRVIDTGWSNSSPAKKVLGAVGGGILGNVITNLFTHDGFYKGLGTGVGAYLGMGEKFGPNA